LKPLTISAIIGLGAAIGANMRYWLGGWISQTVGTVFPWGTMIVNVSGSLLIGIFLGFALELGWPMWVRWFVGIGLLGGYTTFSTFSFETLQLIQSKTYSLAFGNMVASVLAGLLACWIGLVVARWIVGA